MAKHRMSRISAARALSQTFRLALEYHCAGFLLDAAELYAEICAVDPLNADARFLLGVIARQTRRFRPAAKLVAEAIALNPRKTRFHRELQMIRTLENRALACKHEIYPGSTNTPSSQTASVPVPMHDFYPVWMPMPAKPGQGVMAAHA